MQVLLALAKVDEWQFDAFELEEVTGGWPLSTLTFALFAKLKLTHSRSVGQCRWSLGECMTITSFRSHSFSWAGRDGLMELNYVLYLRLNQYHLPPPRPHVAPTETGISSARL